MIRFYNDELETEILSDDQKVWFSQIEHILPWCHGQGLDIGSGGRTIHKKIVRFDNTPNVFPDIIGDGCHLLIPDNSYDFVMSIHSVEHMVDTRSALLEWIRVARKFVCIVGPDVRIHGEVGSASSDPGHKHMFTGEDFLELVLSLPKVRVIKFYSDITKYPDFVCVIEKGGRDVS